MKKNTVATALLGLLVAENAFEKVNVAGLGDIGIKLLTAGERSAIYANNKDLPEDTPFYTVVMKETVVDPETGELALSAVAIEDLKRLPPDVVDDFVAKTQHLNGFFKSDKKQADADLKN